jgi:Mlc titration factor MtfA (ptsG expression regulator)
VFSLRTLYRQWQLKRHPIPAADWDKVLARLAYCQALSPDERRSLRDLVILFLLQKKFEGAAGLIVTDEMRLWVALQASVLILNLGLEYYSGWTTIILYPGDFRVRHRYAEELTETMWHHDSLALVHESEDELSGESWPQGPVILSWQAANTISASQNVVLHEFAHKIDMLNGEADGFPPLHAGMHSEQWTRDFETGYRDLCDALDNNRPVEIDAYAAESPAEFFAVLSETFFIDPWLVYREYPNIYRHLMDFYRQDPRALLRNEKGE